MVFWFPLDVALCIFAAAVAFIGYVYFTAPKQIYRKYKIVSKKFQNSGLSRALGITEEFHAIQDRFFSLDEVSKAIKIAGLESSNMIVGVDFTASNEWQGRKSFNGKCLHHIYRNNSKKLNPYQKVIQSIGQTLEPFDEDNLIPVFGFGDVRTKDQSVFCFNEDESLCKGFKNVLKAYNNIVRRISLSGPTSFAPIIEKAIEIVKREKSYYILVIIADGQVVDDQDLRTRQAIVDASNFALSIILVGVGDGPWDRMHEYDELLPQRRFDNFQFIEYDEVTEHAKFPDAAFALHALMEIPDQYKSIKRLGLLSK